MVECWTQHTEHFPSVKELLLETRQGLSVPVKITVARQIEQVYAIRRYVNGNTEVMEFETEEEARLQLKKWEVEYHGNPNVVRFKR